MSFIAMIVVPLRQMEGFLQRLRSTVSYSDQALAVKRGCSELLSPGSVSAQCLTRRHRESWGTDCGGRGSGLLFPGTGALVTARTGSDPWHPYPWEPHLSTLIFRCPPNCQRGQDGFLHLTSSECLINAACPRN